SYDSSAPLERTLKSFAVDLTRNPGFGQILNQARGEKVEVALLAAGAGQPAALTGTLVGVQTKLQPQGDGAAGQAEPNLLRAGRRPAGGQAGRRPQGVLPQPGPGGRAEGCPGGAGPVPRHREEGGEYPFRGGGQAAGAGRLRGGEPHLEDQLPPGAGQGGAG